MCINKLYELSAQFRMAIEEALQSGVFSSKDRMYRFPNGCCDDASDLLAYYLKQQGINTVQICGTYRDDNPENTLSHAWIKTGDDIIIDITGDQFHSMPELFYYSIPVYVGDEDLFHKLFVEKRLYDNFNFEPCESSQQKRMMMLYQNICTFLPAIISK